MFSLCARCNVAQDGYTDLRGRFDYVSVTTDEKNVAEFALLIAHRDYGAMCRTAKPPAS